MCKTFYVSRFIDFKTLNCLFVKENPRSNVKSNICATNEDDRIAKLNKFVNSSAHHYFQIFL